MKHNKLLDILNKFQSSDKSCKKVCCTTCGGLAHVLNDNTTPQTSQEIKAALSELSVKDFVSLGEWCEYLKINYPISVYSIYERESNKIDISDIQQLDYYLFHSRKAMKNTAEYKTLLDHGIRAATETSNDSLIETVSIILGDKILNYDELFQAALVKSKTNKNIHRVLYNSLREKIPQVRDYVGDGASGYGW